MPEPISELNGLSVEYYCERIATIDVTEYAGHQYYYSSLCEATERLCGELDSKLEALSGGVGESPSALSEDLLNLRSELVSLRDSASSNRDSISDIVTILTRLREDAERLHAEDADWEANVDEDDAATLRSIRESVRAELQSKVLEADAVLWHRALTMSSPPPSMSLSSVELEPRQAPVVESMPVPAGEPARPSVDRRPVDSAPRRSDDREPAAPEPTTIRHGDTQPEPAAEGPPRERVSDIIDVDGMEVEVTIEMDGEMLKLSDIEIPPRPRRGSADQSSSNTG